MLGKEIGWTCDEDYDAFLHYSADSNGLYIGELEGKKVSYVIMSMYGHNEFCFIGYYIVDPKYRGKGYGTKMWDYAWSHIPDSCHSISLTTSTPAMIHKYENKYGFKAVWKDLLYICSPEKVSRLPFPSREVMLKDIRDCLLDNLIDYDKSVFGYRRDSLIKSFISIPICTGWVAYDKQGKIEGYCNLIKLKGQATWSVSPLYAEHVSIALVLLKRASLFITERDEEANFMITPPDTNHDAIQLVQSVSIRFGKEFVRMFARGIPEVIKENFIKKSIVFSLCTSDLG